MKGKTRNSLLSGDPHTQQVGGTHYAKYKIQPVDIINELGIDYIRGNILKYLVRYKDKNGMEDLRKALHYSRILLEQQVRAYPKIDEFIEQLDGVDQTVRNAIRTLLGPASNIPLLQDQLVELMRLEGGKMRDLELEDYEQQVKDEDVLLK